MRLFPKLKLARLWDSLNGNPISFPSRVAILLATWMGKIQSKIGLKYSMNTRDSCPFDKMYCHLISLVESPFCWLLI